MCAVLLYEQSGKDNVSCPENLKELTKCIASKSSRDFLRKLRRQTIEDGQLSSFSKAGHFTFAWQDFPDRHWQSGSGTQKNSVHRKVTSNLCMNQFDLFRMKQYYLEACFRPGELARNKPLSRWQFSFEWEWQLQNVMWGFERKERKREGKQLKNTNRLIILCFN